MTDPLIANHLDTCPRCDAQVVWAKPFNVLGSKKFIQIDRSVAEQLVDQIARDGIEYKGDRLLVSDKVRKHECPENIPNPLLTLAQAYERPKGYGQYELDPSELNDDDDGPDTFPLTIPREFRSIAHALRAHPELRPLFEARSRAFGRVISNKNIDGADLLDTYMAQPEFKEWNEALIRLDITFTPRERHIGWPADDEGFGLTRASL